MTQHSSPAELAGAAQLQTAVKNVIGTAVRDQQHRNCKQALQQSHPNPTCKPCRLHMPCLKQSS
jgi:hypothetical protein